MFDETTRSSINARHKDDSAKKVTHAQEVERLTKIISQIFDKPGLHNLWSSPMDASNRNAIAFIVANTLLERGDILLTQENSKNK
jgi:hypothetical protein|tara:strand:- start:592 stop:846 length:255 start_codon:yes stop_codon:yes gene_type:complete